MPRFIVRFRRQGPSRQFLEELSTSPELTIVETTPRMVLVDGSEKELRRMVAEAADAGDAVVVPEVHYDRPDPIPKVESD